MQNIAKKNILKHVYIKNLKKKSLDLICQENSSSKNTITEKECFCATGF